MNYSEPLITQFTVFLRSLGAGVILGAVYEVIALIRAIFGQKKCVYVTFDITFALVASVISFFFMVLYNSGQIRFHLMLGELAGGLAFHLSVGRYIVTTAEKYILLIKKFLNFLLSPLRKIYLRIREKLKAKVKAGHKSKKEPQNSEKNKKIFINIRKILLKNKNKSV